MAWRAWHVFLTDRAKTDQFLINIVAPLASKLQTNEKISNWFFIRYWENGPHIRLRFENISSDDFVALGGELRKAALATIVGESDAPGQYLAPMRFDGWHSDPASLPRFDQGDVHEIMYEPEYRRYGGVGGLPIAEAMFGLSSRLALKSIAATDVAWAQREALALRFTAVAIMAVARDDDDILEFLRRMAAAWLGFAPNAEAAEAAARDNYDKSVDVVGKLYMSMRGRALTPKDWPPIVVAYAHSVTECLRQLTDLAAADALVSPLTGIAARNDGETQMALMSIVMSFVHMLNNRLGLTPMHEYQFAQMLLWAARASGMSDVALDAVAHAR